jgi:predicted lipoprotein with Yx(FWY)xxD motif
MAAAIVVMAGLVAACSSAATASPPADVATTVPSAVPSVAPSTAPSAAPTASVPAATPTPTAPATTPAPSAPPAAAGGPTIKTATVGSRGTLIVAANGMTVYTFTGDKANSGKSECTGACIATWPAVTVPKGTKPSAGSGAGGKLGTITRPDDGKVQVTYNGLPLYFFSGDQAVGDSNGVYTGWEAVKP